MIKTEAKARKGQPIHSGVLKYFPNALLAIAECSRIGNEQHNAGKPLHWDRSKSGDELDALTRHLIEAGTMDSDGIRHSAKVAWRALANLEKEIEMEKRAALKVEPEAQSSTWMSSQQAQLKSLPEKIIRGESLTEVERESIRRRLVAEKAAGLPEYRGT